MQGGQGNLRCFIQNLQQCPRSAGWRAFPLLPVTNGVQRHINFLRKLRLTEPQPLSNAACELGLPVAVHPGFEGVGVSLQATAVGQPGSYLEWHTSLSGVFQAHLVSLIAEGTFQRHPTLRFVLVEGGVEVDRVALLESIAVGLDDALADRFPFIVGLPSFAELSSSDRVAVIQQRLEPVGPDTTQELRDRIRIRIGQAVLVFRDVPSPDGKPHDKDLKVQVRKGYYASKN